MNLAVIGLGKLGLPFAAWLASKGHQITGIDKNPSLIKDLQGGICPIQETSLPEYLSRSKGHLLFVEDGEDALVAADIIFIVVPTPSEPSGAFSIHFVLEAIKTIGHAMARQRKYRLVVVTSTVMPGQMAKIQIALEQAASRKCGPGFGLCYNPEFIALGSVLRDLDNPDLVLVGQSDGIAGAHLGSFYAEIYREHILKTLHVTSFINAEVAKLSINAFLTTKIMFACQMARLAEKIPGADVDILSAIVGADSRIGQKYLTGGNGYGGPCFPRDARALAQLEYSLGVSPRLIRAVEEENESQIWVINSRICELTPEGGTVLVLGMAYKPGTAITDESQGKRLISGLKTRRTLWYDPMVKGGVCPEELNSAISSADAVVIMQPCPEFKGLDYGDTAVIDCWRLLRDCPPKKWHPMGIGGKHET